MVGIASQMPTYQTEYDNQIISNLTTQMQMEEERATTDTGIYGTTRSTANRDYEGTAGNAITWGRSIISILLDAFNPLSFHRGLVEDEVYYPIIDALIFFRSILAMIAGLELYMIIKNRKTS